MVVCPASLVNNWAAELQKWLQGRCPCTAVADSCKDKVVSKFEGFKYDRQVREFCSRTHIIVLSMPIAGKSYTTLVEPSVSRSDSVQLEV